MTNIDWEKRLLFAGPRKPGFQRLIPMISVLLSYFQDSDRSIKWVEEPWGGKNSFQILAGLQDAKEQIIFPEN